MSAPAKHLHHVHDDREGRNAEPDSTNQCQLETPSTTASGVPITSTMFGAQSVADFGTTYHQSDGMQTRGASVEVKSSEQDSAGGPLVAFSEMGSSTKDPGCGHQEEQRAHEGTHADVGTDLQVAGETRGHSEISCAAEQDEASPGNPMEVGTGHERPSIAYPPDLTGELQRVATCSAPIEASSSTPVKAGRRPYEAQQEKVDRSTYCQILSDLVLVNDSVQCYVNATFLTIMWTHLMCIDFHMGSWGDATAIFLGVLQDGFRQPLCLKSHMGLQAGFSQWQQLRGEGSNTQQDYGEFLHYFLGWISSKHVALTTSRRFLRADEVVMAEKSDAHSPILLHSDLWHTLTSPKQFQHVLDQWHQTNGMVQAIEQASHILCFQICRFQDAHIIDRTILEFGNLRVVVPCFTDARLSLARIPYQIAALVHYHGNSRGGHYNCVIAYLDKYGDSKWLYHEDNCKPVVWTVLPEWFLADVTHVWLNRGDKFFQWKEPVTATPTQETALANVLAQLRDS